MIETLGLRFGYPGGAGLRFADVRIEQGGTLLLRGPSGSGKSTWLALAAGLLTATEGEMIVAGQPLRPLGGRARDAWRAGAIGLLPQKLYLSDALSVAGNLALVYYAAGLPVDHARSPARWTRWAWANWRGACPRSSRAGRRNAWRWRAPCCVRRRVILADEPTASLDDVACASALGLLRQSAQACGATLVIATHDRRVAEALPQAAELIFSSQNGINPASMGPGPL
jgi:putative ABC transport system ATP-binding protein